MFFTFSVLLYAVLLLNLEIIVCTIIKKDLVISLAYKMAVFIDFRLYEVAFITENVKRPINIVQFVCWFFKEF